MIKSRNTCKILFAVALGLFTLWQAVTAEGKERDIALSNRDKAEENAGGLFFVGDSGRLCPVYEEDDIHPSRWEYISDMPEIVSADESGRYTVKSGGKAVVSVFGYDSGGDRIFEASFLFPVCADTSLVQLEDEEINLYRTDFGPASQTIALRHAPDFTYYTFEYHSSNGDIAIACTFDPVKKTVAVSSYGGGTTTLTITINGTSLSLTVHTHIVSINKSSSLLAVKGKTTLKIKDYTGQIKWKSTNKKIVSVDKNGKITGKKTGNAVVYATLGKCRIGCAVSVVTEKRKAVINAAKKIARGTYSQAKRMKKGFYDCSSLVWRSYKKAGKYFGDKSYAPVAANIAKWCIQRKKKIKGGLSDKNIMNMKLRPGDLLFQTGSNNGRYKGIYHVEMFTGYTCLYFEDGKPVLTTLWATRKNGYGLTGALMARP